MFKFEYINLFLVFFQVNKNHFASICAHPLKNGIWVACLILEIMIIPPLSLPLVQWEGWKQLLIGQARSSSITRSDPNSRLPSVKAGDRRLLSHRRLLFQLLLLRVRLFLLGVWTDYLIRLFWMCRRATCLSTLSSTIRPIGCQSRPRRARRKNSPRSDRLCSRHPTAAFLHNKYTHTLLF